MKKQMEWIGADAALLTYMLNAMRHAPEALSGGREWNQAFRNLLEGTSASVMVEMEGGPRRAQEVIHAGELTIDGQGRRVLKAGKEISLTPKEFDILLFLAKNRGEVFSKEQIYQAVWDEHYLLDDSNIMAFIRKIRKKIETNPDEPRYIQTIWGIGYKFSDEN